MKILLLAVAWFCVLSSLLTPVRLSANDGDWKRAQSDALVKTADERLAQASTTQDFLDAAGILEQAVKIDKKNFSAQKTLGWIYIDKLHDPDEAYPHLKIAAKGLPDDVDARKLYALACIQTGRTHTAAKEFEAASRLAPNDQWIRANYGRALAKLRRYDEADAIFTDVLKVEPNNADALLGRAELEAWHGHTTGALATLDKIVVENPKNAEAFVLRGDVHRWNWDLHEAEDDYRAALKLAPNYVQAKDGLFEAEKMGASDIHGSGYYFKDTDDFKRESVEAGTRIHLSDNVYLIGRAAGWRFSNPGFDDLDRLDAAGGLEVNWSRALSTTLEAGIFDYEDRGPWVGGRLNVKISPTPWTDFYLVGSYQQPFVSSIVTVNDALREDSGAFGLDIKLNDRFSFQNGLQYARITDENHWWEDKFDFSYRLFGHPYNLASFVRVEYDYITYIDRKLDYWTPHNRHSVGPVLDICIPITRYFRIDLDGKAPYIFHAEEFGWIAEGGFTVDFGKWVQLKASYIYADIPEDKEDITAGVDTAPWSGHGGQVSLRIRF